MTYRIVSDHEVALQMKIDAQGKALQKSMNEVNELRKQLAEALITYHHKDGTTRFEQYAKDPVPVWAVDVQPVAQQAEQGWQTGCGQWQTGT